MRKGLCVLLALTILTLSPVALAAETKDYFWEFINVDVAVLPNGDLQIAETQRFVFTQGSFHHAYRWLPTDRFDSIANVEVWEGPQKYKPSTADTIGGYTTRTESGNFQVDWWFPYTENAARTFTIKYLVKGALRVYDGGDQLWWKAIGGYRGKPVRSTQTIVHLPVPVPAEQLKVASYGATAQAKIVDAQTIAFTSGELGPGVELEVRVQFPHGLIKASPPAWQKAFDEQRAWEEKTRPWFVLAAVLAVAVALFIPLGSLLGLYSLWYSRGRDKPTGFVAEYLAAPPSDLPAGVVGTLIDEKADMKDIVASMVDLAHRGVIKITETRQKHFLGESRDFTFVLLDPQRRLRPVENTLIDAIFGGSKMIALSDLREKFYTSIPKLKEQLYAETIKKGFFTKSPEATRRNFVLGGAAVLVLTGIYSFCLVPAVSASVPTAVCLSFSLGAVGFLIMVFGIVMPRKTDKGALETARWKAFRNYLENIEKYGNIQEARSLFDRYLPYAIALGVERGWVNRFARIGIPAPTWYETYPPLIIAHPSYEPAQSQGPSVGGRQRRHQQHRGRYRTKTLSQGGLPSDFGGIAGCTRGAGGNVLHVDLNLFSRKHHNIKQLW